MPRTVQIRDLDDAVYDAIAKRAADVGLSVPELLRREVVRLASRPSVDELLERTRRRPAMRRGRDTLEATLVTLDARLVRATGPSCTIEVVA